MNGTPDISTRTAKQTMSNVLRAQRSGQFVQWIPIFSRVHVSGFADPTGLVAKGTILRFFSGTQSGGKQDQGFNRQLTAADTIFRAGEAIVPAGQEFVLFAMGVALQPESPDHIKEAIAYNATLKQRRNRNTLYDYGPVAYWTNGDFGLQAKAATSTVSNIDYRPSVNGASGMKRLQENALIALPAKQPVEFELTTHAEFYATDNGRSTAAAI